MSVCIHRTAWRRTLVHYGIRHCSTRTQQNVLFDQEKKRQAEIIARVEKIEIEVPDANTTLVMNKLKSTPYHCAMHIHEALTKDSPVVELDDGLLWDMHRPLERDGKIKFRSFREANCLELNKVFWRSCSFLLGMAAESAFRVPALRHSWPRPKVEAGCFVYDVALASLPDWKPTISELRTLTSVLWKIKEKGSRFERLEINAELAKQIFADNRFKLQQIATMNSDKIVLYRLADHIDISVGPMLADTTHIGRANVTAVHRIDHPRDGPLYRFQGIAIPRQLSITHYAYQVLCRRAEKLYAAQSQ